ncbi:uncharacterized protein EV420DRAFT_605686 [Desarmillaria tabescens]|uniref:Uncharacterized protein n=1 Tax=Armillaria tabescens TaxID=1929756 RepID=A0AA39N0Z8_ARMTA|nr:uncharacterized protein EV420DRAFT_605686 [Desarmillaria tabescens]KAK0454216.1 hypothetical protein EV420DRAFT_605686 [Desarmillaria tabescens]
MRILKVGFLHASLCICWSSSVLVILLSRWSQMGTETGKLNLMILHCLLSFWSAIIVKCSKRRRFCPGYLISWHGSTLSCAPSPCFSATDHSSRKCRSVPYSKESVKSDRVFHRVHERRGSR